jgi:hypothetical protein
MYQAQGPGQDCEPIESAQRKENSFSSVMLWVCGQAPLHKLENGLPFIV